TRTSPTLHPSYRRSLPAALPTSITPGGAVQRVPPRDLDQLFHPMVDPRASVTLVAKGLPASPGAATGEAGRPFATRVTDARGSRSAEHTSELQSPDHLVCRLLLE